MRQGFNLWMITLFLASVIVISAATPPDPVVHWKEHFSNRHARGSIGNYSNAKHNISDRAPEFSSSRFRRNPNDDAFSTLQSRISSLARIVSGVTLYNGLVDGSIPVDEAIGELMNIGSFSLDDLMKFEEKKANGFAGQLKTASTGITDQGKESETVMIDLLKIKTMWAEVGDLTKLPDNSKFGEIQSMKDFDLNVIETSKLDDAILKLTLRTDVPTIKSDIIKLTEASKKAVDLMEKKKILETLAKMTPFHKYVNLVRFTTQWEAYLKIKAIKPDEVKADIKILQGIGNDATSIFQIMTGISLSQSVNHIDREHTSGFVNGYADLKHLLKDLDDSWLRENFPWLELKDGLTTVSNLEAGMKTLNEKWTELRKVNIRKAVQQAAFFKANLKGIGDTLNVVDKLVTEVKQYPVINIGSFYKDNLAETSQTMLELLEKGKAIQEIAIVLEQNNKLISKMNVSDATSIDSVIDILVKIQSHIDLLQNGNNIKDLAQVLIGRPTDYTEIVTGSSSKAYQDFFNKLRDQKGDDLEKVATAAELAIRMRELRTDKDFTTHIGIASTIVTGSVDSIKSIRTTMEDIKKSSADITRTFSQLKDLQKFSKPLGDSSAIIIKIQKVLEKEEQLLYFVNNGDIVEQLTKSDDITDKIKNPVKKLWEGYNNVSRKSKILLDEVKKRKDGVTKPIDDKLESYGPIIEGLDGLGDVTLNVDRRIMAIGVLLPSITDKNINTRLGSLQSSLTELAYLDLTFARQSSSLKGMTQVLAGINDVFLGTTPATTTKKPAERILILPRPVEESYAYPRWEKWNATGYSYDDYYRDTIREIAIWVGTGVGIVCVIFSGLSGYVLWRERKQEEKEEAKLKQKKEKPKRKKTRKTKKSTSKSTETVNAPPRPSGRVQLVAPPAPALAPPPPAPVPAAVFPVVPVAPPPAVVPAAPVGPAPVPRPEVVAAPPPNPNPAPAQGPAPAAAPVPNPAPVPVPDPAPQAPAQNPNPNPAQNPDGNHGAAQQNQNEEYFDDQNEDETLRCVKSIEN